jgi:fibrillarin-like rRNA methylase
MVCDNRLYIGRVFPVSESANRGGTTPSPTTNINTQSPIPESIINSIIINIRSNQTKSIEMAQRILLIGASKNIGYHILQDLAPQPTKYTLHVLARSNPSTIPPFKGKENITFIQGDAKDPTTIQNTITSIGTPDYIIITVGNPPHNSVNSRKHPRIR